MDKIANTIASLLHISSSDISDIQVLKSGMTNQSYSFQLGFNKYIIRCPGIGTDQLVDRHQEIGVYKAIRGKGICSDPVIIDEQGYKITRFIDNARVCNPFDQNDVVMCINKLREMHSQKIIVEHTFNIPDQIEKYEKLWCNNKSRYNDYATTKQNALSLQKHLSVNKNDFCLTHIDAVPDNFLIIDNINVELIDWEYAGMQDPLVDLAMFAIYAGYNKEQIDSLIDIYFKNACPLPCRLDIYCYISLCGLLWSNWCEYKAQLGVHFGDYAFSQYKYAKDYYSIAMNEIKSYEQS